MSKRTWLREGRTIYEPDGKGGNRWFAAVQDAHTPQAELIEVARLMAAAPELLEELKHLLRVLETPINGKSPMLSSATLDPTRAVIAKAEGT